MSDRHIVGVDLGGTSINVGIVPYEGGTVLGMRSMPTDVPRGAKFVVDRMVGMIRASFIANAIGLTAVLDNDANCAALGEYWQGAGRNVRNLVAVTLGTGIGGGIVLDGRVFHGASDLAGEVGHMTIDSTGRKCKCGNYGCLEAYASGPAIAARAIEGLEAGAASLLPSLVDGDLSRLTAETVYEAIVAGDVYAKEVMRETAKFLGTGLANLINLLNPDMIVISGGVTRAGEHLLEPLRSEVRRRAFRKGFETCEIVVSELGGMAGVVGAAATFRVERCGGLG